MDNWVSVMMLPIVPQPDSFCEASQGVNKVRNKKRRYADLADSGGLALIFLGSFETTRSVGALGSAAETAKTVRTDARE